MTTVNLQYIEERGASRWKRITGKHVTQTVPLRFISQADEIVIVDTPTDLSMNRAIHMDESVARKQEQLSALREIALVSDGGRDRSPAGRLPEAERNRAAFWHAGADSLCASRRVLMRAKMIESAKRTANRFHGDLIVAYVGQPDLSAQDRKPRSTGTWRWRARSGRAD